MNISTIKLPTNQNTKIYFGNECVSSSPLQQNQPKNKMAENTSNQKLFFGLGVLSLAIIAGLGYKKLNTHKGFKKETSEITNNKISSTFNLHNIMENFAKKISNVDILRYDDEFKKIGLPKYDAMDFLKSGDAKNFVKYILTAKKSRLNEHIVLPQALVLGHVNSKTKDISKILSTALSSNFASTKYTKGYMKEFIESLDSFSSNALRKFNEERTHTFLHFDNASEFLTDLKLKENEQLNARFNKIIAKNHENKIVYIVDDNAAKQLNTDTILKLEFDEKINSTDLVKDLEEVEFQLGSKLATKTKNIDTELSEYIKPNGSPSFYMIRNLLLDTPNEKVFLVDGKDKDVVENAIKLISLKTNNTYEKIDCKEISDLSSYLAKAGEKADELYSRNGKRTFLYLDNLQPSQQINDFITAASEKYHIIPVLNVQNNEIISKLNLPEKQIFKMDFWDKGQKVIVDSIELMNARAKKNDFSHVSLERLQREFFNLIAAEKSGMKPKIKNGILLHGSDNLTRITADAIKNTVDANYIKLNYDKKDPEKLIIDIIEKAEKTEEIFEQTRKRTIIEANGLDNILTLNIKVPEDRDLINEFKSIAEDLSEKHHTTLILRTDKPLELFEAASIASNRLGMHIEVK